MGMLSLCGDVGAVVCPDEVAATWWSLWSVATFQDTKKGFSEGHSGHPRTNLGSRHDLPNVAHCYSNKML